MKSFHPLAADRPGGSPRSRLAVVALALCACRPAADPVRGDDPSTGEVAVADAASPSAGGDGSSVTLLYDADERIFGPYWSVEAWFLMFLPLARYDGEGEVVPRLARSWEASPDFRTWTFHLRDDVRWHDGTPTTAHDVKWSIELAGHPEVLFDDPWKDVDSMTVRDDTTLVIHYRRPKDARNTWMVYWPKHLLEDLDPAEFGQWEFWTEPTGNGPYRYVRHVPKTMVELEANPDFYAGKPRIDRLVIKFAGTSGITELLSGNVDILTWLNQAQIPKIEADPRFRLYYHFSPEVAWLKALFWNHDHPVLGDPRVRRALTLAMDRRGLLAALNLPEDLPIADVPFTSLQYLRGEIPEPLPHDAAGARALLEEVGWRDVDGDGIRERAGEPLRFTALVASGDVTQAVAILLQAALREVGVGMEVQPLEMSLLRSRAQTREYDALFFPLWNALDGHLSAYGSESVVGYSNPRVDSLLRAAKETADPAERAALYREAAPSIQRDLPITLLFPSVTSYAVHRRIRGLESPHRGDPVTFMEHLWVEEPP